MPSLRLQFLGTGAPVPTPERVQTGVLMEFRESTILIDCGSGILHRLAQSETDIVDISTLLLTHFHVDHVSDLVPFLKARLFLGEPSLTVIGPDGTGEFLDALLSAYNYLREPLDINVREVAPGSFAIQGFDVTATETIHVMDCLAYRLTPEYAGAPSVTFGGDSEASSDLIVFADGSDVLIHDCAYPDDFPNSPHATPAELGKVLNGAEIGQTYLTHLTPETNGKQEAMLESIREHYDGDVRIAHDGLVISID